MYSIDGDMTFDEYSVELDDEFRTLDYDDVEQNHISEENNQSDTNILFE